MNDDASAYYWREEDGGGWHIELRVGMGWRQEVRMLTEPTKEELSVMLRMLLNEVSRDGD